MKSTAGANNPHDFYGANNPHEGRHPWVLECEICPPPKLIHLLWPFEGKYVSWHHDRHYHYSNLGCSLHTFMHTSAFDPQENPVRFIEAHISS